MESKRILVADDDIFIRILLSRALEICGYEIDTVRNGLEALRCLKNRDYDLLITDYMMPEMDGLKLLKIAKSLYPSIPAIIISGTIPFNGASGFQANACIAKPVIISKLRCIVADILDTRDNCDRKNNSACNGRCPDRKP